MVSNLSSQRAISHDDMMRKVSEAASAAGLLSILSGAYDFGRHLAGENIARQAGYGDMYYPVHVAEREQQAEANQKSEWLSSGIITMIASKMAPSMIGGIALRHADRMSIIKQATRAADASINEVHRDGVIDESILASDSLGSGRSILMLWFSALSRTTRPWHASRHGRCYTPKEIYDFYSEGGNRFNCKCTVVPAVVDKNGEVSQSTLLRMARERAEWGSNNAKTSGSRRVKS